MKQGEKKEEFLVEAAADPVGSLDVLVDRCLPALTSRMWETCSWRIPQNNVFASVALRALMETSSDVRPKDLLGELDVARTKVH